MARPSYPRKWRRYHLGFFDGLQVRIEGSSESYILTTLGGGGCALIGQDPLVALVPPQKVKLRFSPAQTLSTRLPFQITADLLYVTPHNMMTGQKYFGFRFEEPERSSIDPIMRDMSELAARGAVEEAR